MKTETVVQIDELKEDLLILQDARAKAKSAKDIAAADKAILAKEEAIANLMASPAEDDAPHTSQLMDSATKALNSIRAGHKLSNLSGEEAGVIANALGVTLEGQWAGFTYSIGRILPSSSHGRIQRVPKIVDGEEVFDADGNQELVESPFTAINGGSDAGGFAVRDQIFKSLLKNVGLSDNTSAGYRALAQSESIYIIQEKAVSKGEEILNRKGEPLGLTYSKDHVTTTSFQVVPQGRLAKAIEDKTFNDALGL